MALYLIIEIEIKDQECYLEYVNKVYSIVTKYGGKYLARGGDITPISNSWNPERIIIIEFQNKKQMQKCFQSSEYLAIAPLREKSTMSRAIAVEGCL
jgi:uncharacterized protein (DUF1330 family)